MKNTVRTIAIIFGLVLVGFTLLIVYATVTDYQPPPKKIINVNKNPSLIPACSELTFLIWNIGYCGLGSDMDFFYDGGRQVKTSEANVTRNIEQISSYLDRKKNCDFILLQEVDRDSSRSYSRDEYELISKKLKYPHVDFAVNYLVAFVPVPYYEPLGKVYSGLVTFSKNIPASSVRYAFPGNYKWPKSIFMLDRCFLVNRYPVSDGKELLVINTHNSAYDKGFLRKKQMVYLKGFIQTEYAKGNYIIVGGDWNQCPPEFTPEFDRGLFDRKQFSMMADDFLPKGWTWFFDAETPTNRRLDQTYKRGDTRITLIDFYLLSPNIMGLYIKTENLDFQQSDHQPVFAKIRLK